MKSNAFGLDIGTTTMKMVYLSRENNTFEYASSAIVATPVPGMQSESPFDQQEMAKFIAKCVSDAKITTNNVNISLPESQVFTKVIDMPFLSEKELANAIYWEAEQYIPAQLETMNLDWNVLRTPKSGSTDEKMQVLLVAAPKALVSKYQAILGLAGLNIASVETDILSTVRSAGFMPNITSLIVHISALSTSLAIVQNGIMVFNYSVPLGGIAMTRAIASDFGFSPTQAEEYKRTYGLSDKNFGGKVGRAIEPILTEILSEIKKALAFYKEKYKTGTPVSQIMLSGGNARLPGIEAYFVKNIGIQTAIENPWKILRIQKTPEQIQVFGPDYAVAIGLALKEYE